MNLDQAIDEFWGLWQQGQSYPENWKGQVSPEQGYRIQLGLLDKTVAGGDAQAGWKVGLTNEVIQRQQGYHEPVFGHLLHSRRLESGHTISIEGMQAPGYEAELCVVLAEDLQGPDVTFEQARAAIGQVAPAIEIVEGRGPFAEEPGLALADNVGQTAFVMGVPAHLDARTRLSRTTVDILRRGNVVGTGRGDKVLGDPTNSVVWLANKLAEFDRTLKAGQVVMTGAFTIKYPLQRGDAVTCHFHPFGRVSFRVA